MKIDKSELPYQIIGIGYLIALVIAEFSYLLFWISVILVVALVGTGISWLWQFDWLKWMEKKDKL